IGQRRRGRTSSRVDPEFVDWEEAQKHHHREEGSGQRLHLGGYQRSSPAGDSQLEGAADGPSKEAARLQRLHHPVDVAAAITAAFQQVDRDILVASVIAPSPHSWLWRRCLDGCFLLVPLLPQDDEISISCVIAGPVLCAETPSDSPTRRSLICEGLFASRSRGRIQMFKQGAAARSRAFIRWLDAPLDQKDCCFVLSALASDGEEWSEKTMTNDQAVAPAAEEVEGRGPWKLELLRRLYGMRNRRLLEALRYPWRMMDFDMFCMMDGDAIQFLVWWTVLVVGAYSGLLQQGVNSGSSGVGTGFYLKGHRGHNNDSWMPLTARCAAGAALETFAPRLPSHPDQLQSKQVNFLLYALTESRGAPEWYVEGRKERFLQAMLPIVAKHMNDGRLSRDSCGTTASSLSVLLECEGQKSTTTGEQQQQAGDSTLGDVDLTRTSRGASGQVQPWILE
ncbi:hypothetical protein FOZ60_014787, partial [Perkinsus olseni]